MKFLTRLFQKIKTKPETVMRPYSAESQCAKILEAYERGQRLTAMSAFILTGATSSDRRLRQVNKRLRLQGRNLQSRRVKTKTGAYIKQFWLEDAKSRKK